MTEQTREAVDSYIVAANKKPGEFLFGGRRGRNLPITTRQYARLVSQWIADIGLDPRFFGTHSLRRTKATLIYRRTGNLRAVQLLTASAQSTAPVQANISGRISETSMTTSAGRLSLRAAIRIASAFGAS